MISHRRQFVVGPAPCRLVPGWQHVRLGSRWLSHCEALPVALADDAEGKPWAILGRAVESRADAVDPSDQIASAASHSVPELYEGWTGRWVLVGSEELHLDATGQLGCYVGRSNDGNVWVSSSPPLAAQQAAGEILPSPEPWPLRYEDPVSWVVPPRSRFPAVRRLLPSQVLMLGDASLRPRPLVGKLEPQRMPGDTLGLIDDALGTVLRRLGRIGPLWVALTAGADSRVVLAVAHRISAEANAFTRLSPRMSLADRLLPPRVAAAVGMDHRFLAGTYRQRNALELVREHSGGHVGAGDAEPFVRGERAALEGLCVGGWGSAVGRDYRMLPASLSEPDADTELLARLLRVRRGSRAYAGLREWVDWVSESTDEGLELRDRFAIEQRQAGWLAAKEQLYDLERLERVNVLNARRTMNLMLSLPVDVRISRSWQHELIRQAAPELAAFPCNPADRHFGLTRAAGRRLRHPVASGTRVGRRAMRAVRLVARSAR